MKKIFKKHRKTSISKDITSLFNDMQIGQTKTHDEQWEFLVSALKNNDNIEILKVVHNLEFNYETIPSHVIKQIGKYCSAKTYEFMSALGFKMIIDTNTLEILLEGISLSDNFGLLNVLLKSIKTFHSYDVGKCIQVLVDNRAYVCLQIYISEIQYRNDENHMHKNIIHEALNHAIYSYDTKVISIILEVIKPMKITPICLECVT